MKRRNNLEDSSDYHKGYVDGVNDTISDTNVHAFFTGVGYGKSRANDTHLGFNSAEERESFERGVQNSDKHFNAIASGRKLAWFDKLIGRRQRKPERLHITGNSPRKARRNKKSKVKAQRSSSLRVARPRKKVRVYGKKRSEKK